MNEQTRRRPALYLRFGAWARRVPGLLCLGVFVCQAALAQQQTPCESEQGISFVCGPQNAEDLVWIEGTDWIIASGMSGDGIGGHLYLLDPAARSHRELYPGSAPAHRWDRQVFGACPGVLDTADFSAHGLAIRPLGDGRHRLYVTSHGAREAVELFDVDTGEGEPRVVWVGCVVMPAHASINSVAPLSDGGFVTTRIMTEGPEAFAGIVAGDITGFLYEWRPGGAVVELDGTRMSAPNGIEVSRDGKSVFVASWGRGEVARFARTVDGGLRHVSSLEMGFRVDNLRWTERNTLLAAGHRLSDSQDCGGPVCIDEWELAEVDPETMTARSLAVKKPVDGFAGATVAIEAADGWWLGTFSGNRIGFIAKTPR